MIIFNIFLLEWKHFIRNPFKVIAVLLFIIACLYGLHNGANLYHRQKAEIEKIDQRIASERQKTIEKHFKKDISIAQGSRSRDPSSPYWAIRQFPLYHFKKPSPAMVYSIGQSEQYGYYKKITFNSSPYDSDLSEEIANPERLQIGTFDFSFALLYLLPLMLLILFYNIKSTEIEQGFMPLIEVQNSSKKIWILIRASFYSLLIFFVNIILIIYGSMLTNTHELTSNFFGYIFFYTFLYILLWTVLYFIVLIGSKSTLLNTLQMSTIYLSLAFIVPGIIHQALSISKPPNFMIELIDVRDQRQGLYDSPSDVIQSQLNIQFPQILDSPIYRDSSKSETVRSQSMPAMVNELKKENIRLIEKEVQSRKDFIGRFFILNPVIFFQNRFNLLSETHFDNYQNYRDEIQILIDKQIQVMIDDLWSGKIVDEERYLEYVNFFSINN